MKLIVLSLLVIFTFICLEECSAANILLLYTIPSKSHLVVVQSLTKELAKRGHKITEFSAFPLEKNYENYRHIEVPMEFGNEDCKIYSLNFYQEVNTKGRS